MTQEEKEFQEALKKTKEVEKEEQKANDDSKARNIIRGAQEVKLEPFGTLVFEWPSVGLSLQADAVQARYKTDHLRKQDIMTEEQLKAIYRRPVTIEIDGKEIIVGSGQWTEEDEELLDSLPKEVKNKDDYFVDVRSRIHELDTELLSLTKTSKKRARLEEEKTKLEEEAYTIWTDTSQVRLKLLEHQNKRMMLFASSLEEQAHLEKLKLFCPSCIKVKDENGNVDFLWKTEDDMLQDGFESIQVITLYNLFLRGVDVSFFGDMLADTKM